MAWYDPTEYAEKGLNAVTKPVSEVFSGNPKGKTGFTENKHNYNLNEIAKNETDYNKMMGSNIDSAIKKQLKGLRNDWLKGQREGQYAELKGLEKQSKEKENAFMTALDAQTAISMNAIDETLKSIIDQTGFVTGLTKQSVATQAANRGILRSGETANRLQSVDIARASSIGQTYASAREQAAKIQSAAGRSKQDVGDKRAQIEQNLRELEMSGLKDLAYQEAVMKEKMKLQEFINGLEMDAQTTKDLLGGLAALGTLVGVGLGYNQSGATERFDYYGTPGTYSMETGMDYGGTDLTLDSFA